MAVSAEADLRTSGNIQGNILAPFNKPYQRFLFISFGNRQTDARNWLGKLLEAGVESTSQVVAHGVERKQAIERHEQPKPQTWRGVSFTSSGLVVLAPDAARDLLAYYAFWQGALVDRVYGGTRRMTPAAVGDVARGDPTQWVVGGPRQYPIDALLTVAADDQSALETETNKIRSWATGEWPAVLSWQDCQRLGPEGAGTEPFGFRDGISQPGVRGFTPAETRNRRREAADQAGSPIIAAGEFVLGYDGEGGSYPDTIRPTTASWMRDGAFQVFLRLRQDVQGWETQMRELAASSGNTIDAAAKAIGRKSDGAPLAAQKAGAYLNDFTFEGDPSGLQTPRSAHIRKMNPRNGTFDDRLHRLLRRGIPFQTPLQVERRLSPEKDIAEPSGEKDIAADKVERGLAFNAFMASIENQFEFLQQSWANSPHSLPPTAPDGPDPVVGVSDAPCVIQRPNATPVEIHFGRFVWTSGAVYAFAPSLETLDKLAGGDLFPVQPA